MRKLVYLLVLLAMVAALCPTAPAQAEGEDLIMDIAPITKAYFKVLSQIGNIKVNATYACGTNYRADWYFAYVRITAVFVWIDATGQVHLHGWTADPPMSLDGETPGLAPGTADFNADGTLPVESPGYRAKYLRWQERRCVDLTDSLLTQPTLAKIWTKLLENMGGAHKYKKALEYLGLDGQTGRHLQDWTEDSMEYTLEQLISQVDQIPDVPGVKVNKDYTLPDGVTLWWDGKADIPAPFAINSALALIALVVMAGVGIIIRKRMRVYA